MGKGLRCNGVIKIFRALISGKARGVGVKKKNLKQPNSRIFILLEPHHGTKF